MHRCDFLIICSAFVLLSTGCTKSEAQSSTPPASSIGIAECDGAMARARTCLDKLQGPAREAFARSISENERQWKEAAKDPRSQDVLKTTCKAAAEANAAACSQ